MELSPEVLIYIQTVKNYLKTNEEARNYFLTGVDEDLFFQHLGEISQKNLDDNGEVMLNQTQFELLKKTLIVLEIATKEFEPEETPISNEDNIFIDMRGYGKICLN